VCKHGAQLVQNATGVHEPSKNATNATEGEEAGPPEPIVHKSKEEIEEAKNRL